MRDPLSRRFSALPSSDSWLQRVRENLRQVLVPVRVFPSSANGAPLHALKWERSPRSSRAQGVSLLTHAALLTAIGLLAAQTPVRKQPPGPGEKTGDSIPLSRYLLDALRGNQPNAGSGSGSGHDTQPPTQGNLPARSSLQIPKANTANQSTSRASHPSDDP